MITSSPTLSGRDTLIHQALRYGSDLEFGHVAAGYLSEGIAGGDAAVAIVREPRIEQLRGLLGPEADRVEFVDTAVWHKTPAQTLAAYYAAARERWWPMGRLRLVTEPEWAGRTPAEILEWKRVEAILNVAFASTPSMILCAYDVQAVPPDVLADAARTHPEVRTGDAVQQSRDYLPPEEFYAESNTVPLARPAVHAAARRFATGQLPALRAFVKAESAKLGLPDDQSLPFVLAVNEVATNIIRHGGGTGGVALWAERGELLCDVSDPGRAIRDEFLGYFPPRADQPDGAGMWAVRQLCQVVEIRSGKSGTLIRMHMRLPEH